MESGSKFEVLSYDDPRQRQRWRQLCDSFENIDVFYYPEYCRLFELHGDGQPYLFVYYENNDGLIIYPFLKRPLNDLLREKNHGLAIFDITSPYGYNGYLRNNDRLNMENFYDCFHNYCKENNIISEFIRFHPLLKNVTYAPKMVNILQERETVVIDLTKTEEAIWLLLESTCRNKIRKALKNNVSVILDESFSQLDIFYDLYTDTMYRLNAHDYYFFSKQWFYSMVELLKNNVVLFHAIYQGKILNSGLFLFNDDLIHYYLSGSLLEGKKVAANNILLYEVARWAFQKKIQSFHLGGGYKPNDSLSRFKASFSPYRMKYYLGGVVHLPQYYEYLCQIRLKTCDLQAQANFFPLYRISAEY